MPILSMKKLTLIALESERKRLLTALSRTKKVHLIDMDEIEDTSKKLDVEKTDVLIKKMAQIDGAMNFIKDAMNAKQNRLRAEGDKNTKVAVKLGGRKADTTFTGFDSVGKNEVELFDNAVYVAERYKHRINEIDSEIAKLRQEMDGLDIYRNLDVAFCDVKDTNHTCALLGVVQGMKRAEFEQLVLDYPSILFALIGEKNGESSVLAFFMKDVEEQIRAVLQNWNFIECTFDYNVTAIEMIQHHKGKIERLTSERDEIMFDKCGELVDYLPELKTLYDYYGVAAQLNETDRAICKTERVFIMQAWIAAQDVDAVQKVIEKTVSVFSADYTDPDDTERVPTVVKTNKFIQPFTAITDMYSLPDYREANPNVFVAVFYWLFMGLMMGDVGYGFVMMLVAALFVKFIRPDGGLKNIVLIIGYSGLSTMIWGVLFGGWFAISFPENSVFSPVLFSPLTNPLGMIELCLILGALHIISAMIMKAANLIRKKHYLDAVLDCFTWIIFDIGLIFAIVGGFASLTGAEGDFGGITNAGLIMMLCVLVVIMFTAGRKNKGFGKVTGGFGGVWSVINLMSDILSYLRLFGLGLTTGVIGMVFNTLAGLLLGSPFTFIFGVVVLLIGHGMNLAINLLGAYVHDARLQHIEFFGKFYTGDGLKFTPLAGNTKYIKLNND